MTDFSERPGGFIGEGDFRLRSVAKRLRDTIAKNQQVFSKGFPRLLSPAIHTLAEILTEFGEDLHNQIGIWDAYESYNRQFWETPLPITYKCHAEESLPDGIHVERTHHFLWLIYPQIIPGTIIAPDSLNLRQLAASVTDALIHGFKKVPGSSGVKMFLSQPNEYGWDVKRKLVWLGSRSYFFRTAFNNYIAEQKLGEYRDDIDITDDFICQQCTVFSGLGATDILAVVLDIADSERANLLCWNERHLAPYKVLTADNKVMRVLNAVSGKEYQVKMNVARNPFKVDSLAIGGLIPWRDEWYWSGRQRVYENASDEQIKDVSSQFIKHSPQIVSRYHDEYAKKSSTRCQEHYDRLMAKFGQRLIRMPDGLSLAAFLEKHVRQPYQQLSCEEQEAICKPYNLSKGRPQFKIPDNLLRSEHEIGIFISPDELMEVMDYFDVLERAFQNTTRPLPEDEAEILQGFIESSTLSPAYVRHMTEMYGDNAIKSLYLLDGCDESYCVDYLLRRYKGNFYKKRYPPVAII